ncbi:MAG: hypothetical protein IT377_32935 [Polyangiaceae bacterium]|nr:hypothetical protein [Polyangiaceae bacterium]
MTLSRRALLVGLALASAAACDRPAAPQGPVARAELGVFFGGQVQERKEIPFTLDRNRQTQGFRLTFHQPLARPAEIRWEIDRPGPRGRGRAVELGESQARVGMTVLDRELSMKPGDPLGTWKIRVFVDGEVALDRSVVIYDAAARTREPVLGKRSGK